MASTNRVTIDAYIDLSPVRYQAITWIPIVKFCSRPFVNLLIQTDCCSGPALSTTLEPKIYNGSCSYLVQPWNCVEACWLWCLYVLIIPVFSKILEKLMHNRLLSFIDKHKLLFEYQFGFRGKHGTNIVLIVLQDKIMSSINDGEIVWGYFFCLSKAFDTVIHDILLKKLQKYEIGGVVYDWFVSNLSERSQYVSFLNHNSSQMIISCGVPQWSILGPLLFLIYVNDLANVSSVLFTLLFAQMYLYMEKT